MSLKSIGNLNIQNVTYNLKTSNCEVFQKLADTNLNLFKLIKWNNELITEFTFIFIMLIFALIVLIFYNHYRINKILKIIKK
jgi:hypothetical protein